MATQMKLAIANQRALDQLVDEMREITQKLILLSPEPTQNPAHAIHPKSPLS